MWLLCVLAGIWLNTITPKCTRPRRTCVASEMKFAWRKCSCLLWGPRSVTNLTFNVSLHVHQWHPPLYSILWPFLFCSPSDYLIGHIRYIACCIMIPVTHIISPHHLCTSLTFSKSTPVNIWVATGKGVYDNPPILNQKLRPHFLANHWST